MITNHTEARLDHAYQLVCNGISKFHRSDLNSATISSLASASSALATAATYMEPQVRLNDPTAPQLSDSMFRLAAVTMVALLAFLRGDSLAILQKT